MQGHLRRLSSNGVVIIIVVITLLVQLQVSYNLTFGQGEDLFGTSLKAVSLSWVVIRAVALAVLIAAWLLDRKEQMYRWMLITTILLTVGLMANIVNLCFQVVSTISDHSPQIVFSDVLALMVVNVLVFSIWYWMIDPPGIDGRNKGRPYDFLFPQRASDAPEHAGWEPRYADYLFVAFTASVAFSPTDTAPLTVRAKTLLMIQAIISLVNIVVILGNTINTLS